LYAMSLIVSVRQSSGNEKRETLFGMWLFISAGK